MHEIQHRFARLTSAPWPGTQRADVVRHACLVTAVRVRSSTDAIGFLDEEATVHAEGSTEALRSLDADRPGAVALVETARQYEAWDHLLLLAFALTEHLRVASHWKELDRVYRCVQEAGELAGHANWTATALYNRAVVAGHLGESQDAVDLYNCCAETARAADDAEHLFMAQFGLGTLLINLGRPRDAIDYLRSGLHYWRTVGHHQVLALALGHLGQAYLAVGQTRRAENYLRNSRDLSRSSGFGEMLATRSIAKLLSSTGRVAEAAEESVRDTERARAIGSREWEARALMDLAAVPTSARPESAPAEPLEAALSIHQETGDVQGQVRALFRLGEGAAHRADLDQAATYLAQCAELAIRIGDHQHAARSLTYLASYSGGIGHHDTAESQFEDASDMAQESGSPVLQADVLQKRAQLLWHRGRIGDAVRLLTEAEQSLAATDESRALAQVRAALGEALVVAGQWQNGARMLQSVVSDFSDAASPSTRARATRALAVLHSRRGLHTEALSAINRALNDCERHNDMDGVLHCRMALGNIHARAGRWAEAADQYEQTARAAAEHKDLHVLLTARAQAATCTLHTGNQDEAVALLTKTIPLAEKLGMDTVLTSLHTNLGTCHAKAGAPPPRPRPSALPCRSANVSTTTPCAPPACSTWPAPRRPSMHRRPRVPALGRPSRSTRRSATGRRRARPWSSWVHSTMRRTRTALCPAPWSSWAAARSTCASSNHSELASSGTVATTPWCRPLACPGCATCGSPTPCSRRWPHSTWSRSRFGSPPPGSTALCAIWSSTSPARRNFSTSATRTSTTRCSGSRTPTATSPT
nr:tetratricopeptide repeat protein [Streptomyces sp. SID8382]